MCFVLTFEKGGYFLQRPEATKAFKLCESDGHLRLVVVVGVVLGKLGMELGSQLLEQYLVEVEVDCHMYKVQCTEYNEMLT